MVEDKTALYMNTHTHIHTHAYSPDALKRDNSIFHTVTKHTQKGEMYD